MDSGYEALPPRETGRFAKRRRPGASDLPVAKVERESVDGDKSPLPLPEQYVENLVGAQYEYLDHTADVQIHSWASSLGDAFAYAALGMFAYKTDPDGVDIDSSCTRYISATGHDVISLLYNFMDACLFEFASDDFVAKDMRVVHMELAHRSNSGSLILDCGAASCSIKVVAFGERFRLSKHAQGTEIKAITYSNMQIFTDGGLFTAGDEVQGAPVAQKLDTTEERSVSNTVGSERGKTVPASNASTFDNAAASATGRRRASCDVYIIVDI